MKVSSFIIAGVVVGVPAFVFGMKKGVELTVAHYEAELGNCKPKEYTKEERQAKMNEYLAKERKERTEREEKYSKPDAQATYNMFIKNQTLSDKIEELKANTAFGGINNEK